LTGKPIFAGEGFFMADGNGRATDWMTESKFDPAKGYTRYSNGTLDWMGGEASGSKVDFKEKVFSIITRAAWGWDSAFAVKWKDKESGAHEPLLQSDIADKLKADPARVSKACTELEKEGRLLPNTGKLLYPSGNPVPLPEPPPRQEKLPDLATLVKSKRLIIRFIPEYPVEQVVKSGNFPKAEAVVSIYKQTRDEAEAEFKRIRQAAEDEMKMRLWEIAKNGNGVSPGGVDGNGNFSLTNGAGVGNVFGGRDVSNDNAAIPHLLITNSSSTDSFNTDKSGQAGGHLKSTQPASQPASPPENEPEEPQEEPPWDIPTGPDPVRQDPSNDARSGGGTIPRQRNTRCERSRTSAAAAR
jgi:hypothetical protein